MRAGKEHRPLRSCRELSRIDRRLNPFQIRWVDFRERNSMADGREEILEYSDYT